MRDPHLTDLSVNVAAGELAAHHRCCMLVVRGAGNAPIIVPIANEGDDIVLVTPEGRIVAYEVSADDAILRQVGHV